MVIELKLARVLCDFKADVKINNIKLTCKHYGCWSEVLYDVL